RSVPRSHGAILLGPDGLHVWRKPRARLVDAEHSRIRRTQYHASALLPAGGAIERRDAVRMGQAVGPAGNRAANQPAQDVGRLARRFNHSRRDRRGALWSDAVSALAGGGDVRNDYARGIRRRAHDVGDQTRLRREGLRHDSDRTRRRARPHRLAVLFGSGVFSPYAAFLHLSAALWFSDSWARLWTV